MKNKDVQFNIDLLKKYDEEYYNKGNSLITDQEYDDLRDAIFELDSSHPYFKTVGIGNIKEKVKHEVPMLSLNKCKSVEEVITWVIKIGAEKEAFIVQPKIDGLSCSAIYENGKLSLIKTRGDGIVGQNITHISKFVNFPKTIDKKTKIEVRGELYLPKTTKLSNPDNKPLRNLAVGLINRKDSGLEDLRHVHFVAYQILNGFDKELVKMDWLEENEFEPIFYCGLNKCGGYNFSELQKIYSQYLESWRENFQYETDGLVITINDNKIWDSVDSKYEVSHHHHYNVALKPPSQGKETVLQGIEWSVSRQGKVIPVALFKPVTLGGAQISRCTLNNYENVLKLRLHTGDNILIERAGDVIPFFKANLSKNKDCGKNIIPTKCPSCGAVLNINGVHLVCNSSRTGCKEQQVLRIIHWVKNCEMEQFSEASVRALFEAGKLWDIGSLYALKESDFVDVPGFGKSKIDNALAQIESTKEMTIGQFVDRLGIDLVGEKAIKKLGIVSIDQLLNFSDATFVIGRNLRDFIGENLRLINQLLKLIKIQKPQVIKMGSKNVCMTGKGPKTRNELILDIQSKGDQFVDHVGKETDILVCEDPNSNSNKLQKAQKFGIKLVSYSEYFGGK